jgi:2-oxoisovalerate dehydrogenase E2 component (dihydrolipoyl transacylase)
MTVKDFKLPDLGEGLEEGDIVAWHVASRRRDRAEPDGGGHRDGQGGGGGALAVRGPGGRAQRFGRGHAGGRQRVRPDRPDVEGGGAADEPAAPVATGDASPAQGGFETGAEAADTAVPDADAEPSEAIAGERRPSTGLDADEEPQPLVGYGQGKGGQRAPPARWGTVHGGHGG